MANETTLTDAEVAALATLPGRKLDLYEATVQALALEVQQSRITIAALTAKIDELEDRLQDAIYSAMGENL